MTTTNTTTNLNIRTEKTVKDQSERIFNELGMTMTTAVNLFLRASIRENGMPFELKLDETPNETTRAAIEEGRRVAEDPAVKGYSTMADLKTALES